MRQPRGKGHRLRETDLLTMSYLRAYSLFRKYNSQPTKHREEDYAERESGGFHMQSITTNQKNNLASATLRWVMPLLLLTVFSATLLAQNATFTGRVTDSSGAVVIKAKIIVHNLATGVDTTTITTKS